MPHRKDQKEYPICPIHGIKMDVPLAQDENNKRNVVYRCPHSDHDEEFE